RDPAHSPTRSASFPIRRPNRADSARRYFLPRLSKPPVARPAVAILNLLFPNQSRLQARTLCYKNPANARHPRKAVPWPPPPAAKLIPPVTCRYAPLPTACVPHHRDAALAPSAPASAQKYFCPATGLAPAAVDDAAVAPRNPPPPAAHFAPPPRF